MKKIFITLTIFCSLTIFSETKKPAWVEKRPISRLHYIGIGVAQKNGNPSEYIQQAKENALLDIASQITITISGEQLNRISEQLGKYEVEFQSNICSSTKAELEAVELVDTWQNDNEYWVYYRIEIEEYEQRKNAKLQNALKLAVDFYSKAKLSEQEEKEREALQLYLQALSTIEKYIGEPLQTTYSGKEIYFTNELFLSLQTLLNRIELTSSQTKFDGQVGKPISQPLQTKVMVTKLDGNKKELGNFPVQFSFVRGEGTMSEHVFSDVQGIAKTSVLKIHSTEKMQIVKANVDVSSSLGKENISPLLQTLLKSFTTPSVQYVLNVLGLPVFVNTKEMLFEQNVSRIEPIIKNQLSSEGFSFIEDASKANFTITIDAKSRKGSTMSGLYVAYLDANFSVIDMNNGEEIYKTALNNVKGISDNYEKAGIKAFDEASQKIQKEILPQLLEKIKK